MRFDRLARCTVLTGLILGCDASQSPAVDESWDDIHVPGKADGIVGDSYGLLALVSVPPAFDEMVAGLEGFGDDTLPHQAKALRKQIGTVRDFVDIFAFAYPDDHGDPWQDIRDDLDEGYETMGAFKDLFDRQGVEDPADAVYDDDEVAALRDEVLAWKAEFGDPERLGAAQAYLADPSLEEMHDRKKADQPRFYWREAGLEPDEDLSGLTNIARLTREILDESREDLADTEDLRNLHRTQNQIAFHDFRKRLRSATKLAGYFPAIFEDEDEERRAELLLIAQTAVDRYGEVNDRLTAYAEAHDEDDDDREDELKEEIADMWKELRDWQDDEDLDEALDDLRALVRH